MALESLLNTLSLAFALGLLHALNGDHVVTVSLLTSRPNTLCKHPRWYGIRWALAHGASLSVFSIVVLVSGIAIPDTLSSAADYVVGLVMVGMGIAIIFQLVQQHALAHANRPASTLNTALNFIHHRHGATAFGALHGIAGSAALLLLISATNSTSIWLGLSYLLLFNIGVLAAMLVFTHVLDTLYKYLKRIGKNALGLLHYSSALASIMVGAYLFQRAF